MKNWDEAEDALSAAMLHAREKIVIHAPNIGNFKGWLYQLTENVCLALLRKRKKQDIYDDRIEGVIAKNKLVTNFLESPEDKYQREDVLEAIYKAVKPLPQHLREAAMPRFFLKMSYRDIALILGITNDNVRKRIQQARAILARELKGLRGAPSALSHLGEKKNNNSPAWSKIIKEVDEALYAGKKELEFLCNATAIVKIYLPVGIEKDIPVFLRRKPGRYKARLKTLKEYVTKYPGGWKKRLELAEIFYALGDWYRAVKELSQVVGVHPQSLYARVLLGQVLLYTGESEKAAKI
jgi:RNA polymerase sigma factor (sigma-70 family)